ncbi:MAG: HAD-IA family hydrolase [Clostridia bacterium]|nr:HAD-IA family hydrolase [Clostridia bacterium]
MFTSILFDFDGTLIDTNDLIIHCLKETSKKFLQQNLTEEDLNRILGKPLEEQMRCLSDTDYQEMVPFYKELYRSNVDRMMKGFPGIKEMLKEIKDLGCKTAIVSAKGRLGIENGLQYFGFKDYIDVIVSAYDVENNKPHPEPAYKALELLGVEASTALLMGDSPYDILCGKNAGIKTVLVNWTIFPKDCLLKLQPDFVIHTPMELVKIIKGSF